MKKCLIFQNYSNWQFKFNIMIVIIPLTFMCFKFKKIIEIGSNIQSLYLISKGKLRFTQCTT